MKPVTPKRIKAQFHALIDAAVRFNSDLTTVIGRDDDDTLLFVAVFARGDDAEELEKYLETLREPGEAGA